MADKFLIAALRFINKNMLICCQFRLSILMVSSDKIAKNVRRYTDDAYLYLRITGIVLIGIFLTVKDAAGQVRGCTDRKAVNYNPSATINDGSCNYTSAVASPVSSVELDDIIPETSGLIIWNNHLWTINDSEDINLYALDTLNGIITGTYPLTGTCNRDWEEISQDDNYVYVGDLGNNQDGNRTDLKILRISKNSILNNTPQIDTIHFSYSDQTDFDPAGPNNTDFDCEAFIVSADSIYLFTKQWVSNKTGVYSLSKMPGHHVAELLYVYDVQGLITGSVYLGSKKVIALCGYDSSLQPFIWLLYDYGSSGFFSGNKRKIIISLPFHQVEGITTSDGIKYYISNESISQPPFFTVYQKLHILDLGLYLQEYLRSLITVVPVNSEKDDYKVFPVPSDSFITVKADHRNLPAYYTLTNQSGQTMLSGVFTEEKTDIDISGLPEGLYILNTGKNSRQSFKVIRK